MAAIAAASSAAATGVSMYGQHQQAKGVKYAAKYNNKVAENEASNRQSEAREQGKRAQIRKRKKLAEIRNSLAGQGTLISSGTPLDILGESSANMQLQIADASRTANMQANSLRAKGQMGLWEAAQFSRASKIKMVGTGLEGISKLASSAVSAKYHGIID